MFMYLGPQMADISVDNQTGHFNTGPYGSPLKNQNFENCFVLHVREDNKKSSA